MQEQALTKIRAILPMLNEQTLRQINGDVVDRLRMMQTQHQQKAMQNLRVGSVAEFYSTKHGRLVRMKVERLNTKSVSGIELNRVDNTPTMTKWKVAPSFLKVVA